MLKLATHSVGFIAILLLAPALAGASPPHLPLLDRGIQRRNGEHVVLADCRDANAVVSSQIAYFEGAPGKTPKDVSIVHTNPGEAALWINANTSGLFTDTGVTFTATIGPKVADGSFAGIGHNGYGGFACWQKYFNNLYEYGGTTCSQVYFCNHDPVPVGAATILNPPSTPTSGAETSSATGPTTLVPTVTGSGTGATTAVAVDPPSTTAPSSEGGLSQGALVGIIVAVVGVVLVSASLAFFFWTWRRYKGQQPAASSGRSGGCCGLFARREAPQPQPDPFAARSVPAAAMVPMSTYDVKRGPGMYEMDGVWYRAEMGDDNEKHELDATGGLGRGFDRDKKVVVPEGLGNTRPHTPQKNGSPEIYALTPGTSETAISEQKVRVRDL